VAGQIAAQCRPRKGFGKTAPGPFRYRNFGDLATIQGREAVADANQAEAGRNRRDAGGARRPG
jgi:hypothetical protein